MLKRLFLIVLISSCTACAQLDKSTSNAISANSEFNILELTIERAHTALRDNVISCEALTRQYINRIRHFDQSTGLNAIIYINPNAINKA